MSDYFHVAITTAIVVFTVHMFVRYRRLKKANDEYSDVFGHKANGEPCCVCKKKMKTKQGITMVLSGEKMHSKCWHEFFSDSAVKILERQSKSNSK